MGPDGDDHTWSDVFIQASHDVQKVIEEELDDEQRDSLERGYDVTITMFPHRFLCYVGYDAAGNVAIPRRRSSTTEQH
jgi:hypothetical protein